MTAFFGLISSGKSITLRISSGYEMPLRFFAEASPAFCRRVQPASIRQNLDFSFLESLDSDAQVERVAAFRKVRGHSCQQLLFGLEPVFAVEPVLATGGLEQFKGAARNRCLHFFQGGSQ